MRKTHYLLLAGILMLAGLFQVACNTTNPTVPTATNPTNTSTPTVLTNTPTSTPTMINSATKTSTPTNTATSTTTSTPTSIVTPVLGDIYTFAGNGSNGCGVYGISATAGSLGISCGVAVDSSGNVYIADTYCNCILKVNTSGFMTTVAGNGTAGSSGDGGPATSAELNQPWGVAVDSSGNLFIADTLNGRLREISTSGTITTILSVGTVNPVYGVAVDSSENIYITVDATVQKVSIGGSDTIFAGTGTAGYTGDGGAATSAELLQPRGVAVDSTGNIYISDLGDHCVRKVNTSGTITTVAGNGTAGYMGDSGPATLAELNGPGGVAVDSSGNIYIADDFISGVACVRKVSTGGIISTFAGNGTYGYSGDGGPATSAEIHGPGGVAVDSSGHIYIADGDNNRIREVY